LTDSSGHKPEEWLITIPRNLLPTPSTAGESASGRPRWLLCARRQNAPDQQSSLA
jgi:hypothetical protein